MLPSTCNFSAGFIVPMPTLPSFLITIRDSTCLVPSGAEELGVDLDEHISFIVDSMKPIAGQIGLNAGEWGG